MTQLNVLDKGYVRLLDVFGDDLMVVNCARASYDRESEELTEKDERLIKFLARENHMSPFRTPRIQFEVFAPLVVARQWWRYAIDSSHVEDGTPWNESSRRYVTEKTEFYLPKSDEWRSKPASSKQGSGALLDEVIGETLTEELRVFYEEGERLYEKALADNVAPEQARLFLPAYGLMVRWRYTASLQSVAHFLQQRLAHDSQSEIQQYAKAVKQLAEPHFPVSLAELLKDA